MTEVTPRGKTTKLASDAKQAKEWINNIPDIDSIFQLKSYDELSKIINDWLAGDEEEEGTEHQSSVSKNKTESESYGSLDDAFADLMDD